MGIPFKQEPHPDLVWFYTQSAGELGLRSASLCPLFLPTEPPTPSGAQLSAARKQTRIRVALRELSPRLQSVLEGCYEPRPHSAQIRHEHGLAAGLVARVISELTLAISTGHKPVAGEFDRQVALSYMLVQAAHEAFAIVYGQAPRTKREAQRTIVSRWMSDEGLSTAPERIPAQHRRVA